MAHIEATNLGLTLPDGRELFHSVSFRVGDGAIAALVGANGTGKTTLLRMLAGDAGPDTGSVTRSGGLGVMRQFVAAPGSPGCVRDLLLSVSAPRLIAAARELDATELVMMERDDEPAQLAYAHALGEWADAGGYDAEVLWDVCAVASLGRPYDEVKWRDLSSLSGGEQKRLALEALLRGPDQVLLLDEPDNSLDVPGKRWLEERLAATAKTVLLVSHDRELLARTATRIITLEARTAWTHGGGFAAYGEARRARLARLDEVHRQWDEEHRRLIEMVRTFKVQAAISEAMAARYRAAQTRLDRYVAAGPPPERPRDQNVRMRLAGGRTGLRALTCEGLSLTGLCEPFDLEVFFGERVAVLGANGSGKSHFLRLVAGEPVAHTGSVRCGARVRPGHFVQNRDHLRPQGTTLIDLLWQESQDRSSAMRLLGRYELTDQAEQTFGTLSGGQKARLQILLLEIAGSTMLLLDEPTDNLDLASAEALEDGLGAFEGTVLAVTHDRWFARSFDRFLVFGGDGRVREAGEPVWDEIRPVRGAL